MSRGFCGQCGEPYDDNFGDHICSPHESNVIPNNVREGEMYTTINTANQFREEFVKMDRAHQFSYNAFVALFEYFEALEEDTGEAIELDPIAICCEWDELTFDQAKNDYSHIAGMAECEDIDEVEELLSDETVAIPVKGDSFLGTLDTLLVKAF